MMEQRRRGKVGKCNYVCCLCAMKGQCIALLAAVACGHCMELTTKNRASSPGGCNASLHAC